MFISIVEYVNETDDVTDLTDDILLSQEKEEELDDLDDNKGDVIIPVIYK